MRTKIIPSKHKGPVSAIHTADWHIRENVPIAYVREFDDDQWEAVDFVAELQKKYDCPVKHSGDLFDHWKPSPELLSKLIEHIPDKFETVYGNHDLPQHNLELAHKCGAYTLAQAKAIKILDGTHWGQEPIGYNKVLVWHIMVYKDVEPFPGCTAPKASRLLKKYPQYDLIVTGDNHQAFVEEYDGRLLVNPGSLMRHTAIQYDFHPRVYLWYAESNTVEPIFLPFHQEAISREHLQHVEERDSRLTAFVSSLNLLNDPDKSIFKSFEENVEVFKHTNPDVSKNVISIIYKAMEGKKI